MPLTAIGPHPVAHTASSKTQQQTEVLYCIQLSLVTRVTSPHVSGTSLLTLGCQQFSGKVRNVSFLTIDPLRLKWHRTLLTPVVHLQNPMIYLPMVSPELEGVVALRNRRVYSSVTFDILHSSVHIYPPVSLSFSRSTVGSVDRMFCSFLGVLLSGHHGIHLSNSTVTLDPLEHTSSLDNTAVLFLLNTLLL
jgi:hypothetical protein